MFKETQLTLAAFVVAFVAISFLPDQALDQSYLAQAQSQSFIISGRVTEPPSGTGTGISGVTVSLVLNGGGTPMIAMTDVGGNFSFAGIAQGSNYQVTPSKTNYIFNPVSQGGTNLSADRTLFFTGTSTATSDTIQFGALSYPVGEGEPQVNLMVTRSGNTTAAASVRFATIDTAGAVNCNVLSGVASSRCDYEIRISTIRFAAGETSKTVSVFIIDDSYLEGAESFDASLSSPAGASLGPQSTATVTITDNEIANGANPIDTAAFFVRLHYLDFLNREPDASGLAFWVNEIAVCGADQLCIDNKRINVSAAFYISIEFQQTGYLVERLYKTAYGDATGTSTLGGAHQIAVPIVRLLEFLPDTQEIGQGVVVGQTGWEVVLENNKQALTAEFVQRSRFTTAFPSSMTASQFVDTLNANAGNPLSTSERNQLVVDLEAATKTRAQVLRTVAEDPDLNSSEFNRAFVLMQYFGYLRRNPNDLQDTDYTGYEFWLTKLNQFNGNFVQAEMVKAFISSTEYRQRFGQ